MNIISASRRTDIPAFYMPWLMNRLREGFVKYPNPIGGQVYTVPLKPEDVHSIVFWSKHFGAFLSHVDELKERDYRFYCHYTLTGLPRTIEPHVPDWRQGVQVFRELSKRTSPRHVHWRFDPILFTDELGLEYYLEQFRSIATALAGVTERCYFSFAVFYGKVEGRLRREGIQYYDPPLEVKQALVEKMVGIADGCGISLYACCEDALLTEGVHKAHCVDGDLLAQLFPDCPLVSRVGPTREQCGCVVSRDIGIYDSCAYGCLYCYANQSHELAVKRLHAHSPEGQMLAESEPVRP